LIARITGHPVHLGSPTTPIAKRDLSILDVACRVDLICYWKSAIKWTPESRLQFHCRDHVGHLRFLSRPGQVPLQLKKDSAHLPTWPQHWRLRPASYHLLPLCPAGDLYLPCGAPNSRSRKSPRVDGPVLVISNPVTYLGLALGSMAGEFASPGWFIPPPHPVRLQIPYPRFVPYCRWAVGQTKVPSAPIGGVPHNYSCWACSSGFMERT